MFAVAEGGEGKEGKSEQRRIIKSKSRKIDYQE
jgi:hypothetical protein